MNAQDRILTIVGTTVEIEKLSIKKEGLEVLTNIQEQKQKADAIRAKASQSKQNHLMIQELMNSDLRNTPEGRQKIRDIIKAKYQNK